MSKKSTLFVDIDGTIVEYRQFTNYKNTVPTPITSTIKINNNAYDDGHCIVLTTARPEYLRMHTMKELDQLNVKYNQLVMGIERGSRILINDRDPKLANDRAYAINVDRDKGYTSDDIMKIINII